MRNEQEAALIVEALECKFTDELIVDVWYVADSDRITFQTYNMDDGDDREWEATASIDVDGCVTLKDVKLIGRL